MTSRSAGRTLIAASGLFLLPLSAHAVGNRPGLSRTQPTMAQYAQDLSGSSPAKRRYAARVLLRQVRTARRQAATGPEDDLTRDQARQTLTDSDRLVAPGCIRHLSVREITAPCADILRLLETQAALAPLEVQLGREGRRGVQRRLQRAITTLKSLEP